MTIIRAFNGRRSRVRFGTSVWMVLLSELDRRGGGRRESGAFLLSPRNGDGRTVARIIYYDDLDPECLVGGIKLRGMAYAKLWEVCDHDSLRVIGDVHTHPGRGVCQSDIDRANPMVARKGHIALILPVLARKVTIETIGVHEYLGAAGWRSACGTDAQHLVYVGRWP